QFKAVNLAGVFKAVLVPFVAGWIVALAFGLLMAKLQYDALVGVYAGEKLAAEYQGQLDHVLKQGALLWGPQIGVVCGLLAWQVGRLGRHSARPLLFGGIAGAVIAIIEGGIALAVQVPMLLVLVMGMIFIGAGTFAGWSAGGMPSD